MRQAFEKISGAIILLFTVTGAICQNTFPTTGNTGIGTTSPQEKLQVVGNVKINATISPDAAYTKISWNRPIGTGATVFDNHRDLGNVGFIFNTTTGAAGSPFTELMRLNANGNVGIGTAAPTAKLQVNGGAVLIEPGAGNYYKAGQYATFGNSVAGNTPYIAFNALLTMSDQSVVPPVNEFTPTYAPGGGLVIWGEAGNSGLHFFQKNYAGVATAQNFNTFTEAFTLTSSGNIGIGAPAALSKLHVAAGANSTALLLQGDNLFSIKVKTYTGGTFATTHRISQVYSNDLVDRNGFIDFIRGGDNSGGAIAIGSNGAERIRIAPNGNVGIATTLAPQSELAVKGTITAQKVKVTQLGWADFVFDPSYPLNSLDHVENFINQNKHLPGVPSAATVEREGIDLGDNQAILLRKIEELTLYVLQQQKELKTQSAKISALEKLLQNK